MPTAVVGEFGMGLPTSAQLQKDVGPAQQLLMVDHFTCEDQSMALLFASPRDEHPENEILHAGQSLSMLIWQVGEEAPAAEAPAAEARDAGPPARKKRRSA